MPTAETRQAAEGRLDVAAGAAEAVVEIEMAEGGVEIVAPHQAHHAAAEPDAFRVAGRAVDGLRGLDEFVGLALAVLGRIGRGCGIAVSTGPGRGSPLCAKAPPKPISSAKPDTARPRKTAFWNPNTR